MPPADENTPASKLRELLKLQDTTAGLIQRFWENTKKTGQAKLTPAVLQSRLNILNEYWKLFLSRHFEIMQFEGVAETDYVKKDSFSLIEECHVETVAKLNDASAPPTSSAPSATKTGVSTQAVESSALYRQIQLPKIVLPAFDGDQLKWENFRDLFRSLVHDVPGIPDVQKLQHLKANLSGEAAELLRNVPMTEAGYAGAWSDLHHRFDNPRIMLFSHMRNLLSAPPATRASSAEINRLLGVANQAVRAFKALGRPVELWDDWFVHLIVQRLDPTTRMNWETTLSDTREFPTFKQLAKFMENRVRALEAASAGGVEPKPTTSREGCVTSSRKPRTSVHVTTASREWATPPCPLCKGNHKLGHCNRFKKMSPTRRREQVRQLNACTNCLRMEHTAEDCPSDRRCMLCTQKHHTFLHSSPMTGGRADPRFKATNLSNTSQKDATDPESSAVHAISTGGTVLLSTAQVLLESPSGQTLTVRALLDQGAEVSLISEWAAQALHLPRQPVQRTLFGAQNVCLGAANAAVNFTIRSRRSTDCKVPARAMVVRTVTGISPVKRVPLQPSWTHLIGLDLADPDFACPKEIDVLLGAEVYGLLLEPGLRRGSLESPTAQQTVFGWILSGSTSHPSDGVANDKATSLLCRDCDSMDAILRRFWELEEVSGQPILSESDDRCEEHFKETHRRDDSGRYTVRLPFRTDEEITLAPSRHAAVRVLLQNERRLHNTTTAQKYADFMREYAALNHMEPVPDNEFSERPGYYLPHHAVVKAHDPLGKIRVVFDASFKTATGYSLNDILLTGPKLQSDLWIILLRWRLFRVVFATDIVKMFRQIRIHPDDADWQRIVWRIGVGDRMGDFRLTTVTYGTTSAPFLALRTLKQLAIDEHTRFPFGAKIINDHTYVDDILAGADNIEQAKQLRQQLTEFMTAGGFELSKWASNRTELTPAADSKEKTFDINEGPNTLGLRWNPVSDSFRLRVDPLTDQVNGVTKRTILATIARFYDPLGWAAPVLITGKILMQNLWLQGLEWDQSLPDELTHFWLRFSSTLSELENLAIPRWVNTLSSNRTETSLHGFCDASQRAYAAAVHLRVISASGIPSSHLLVAKTKVAPVKTVSVPRLELCGAVLLARLMAIVTTGLQMEDVHIYAWTDSSVTLAWIRSHASRWKPFVANRVAEIQSTIPASNWRHVGTNLNPADAATRGMTPAELQVLTLWWQGPSWLTKTPSSWPASPPLPVDLGHEEARTPTTILTVALREDSIVQRFSSLTKLLRITAWCLRFGHNTRQPSCKRTNFITAEEMSRALHRWISLSQRLDFAEDMSRLSEGSPLTSRSTLRHLRPFIDDRGLLRVGGRLHGAYLPYTERHPVILSKTSHLSLLLVRDAHYATLHGGPQLTRSHLMRRYWIVQGGNLIRSVTRTCVRCARFRMDVGIQSMGQLPPSRTTPARPFLSSGVDYAGPVQLRLSKGRGSKTYKGYICLFICLVSKAVHLEAVSDLTSAAFLAAFKRFVSRRGRCSTLLSDNGSCFRGAEKELIALFRAASQFYQDTAEVLAVDGVSWSFIPPYAPHFGGLWEAGIKSVKYHLRRVIGDQNLTFEGLSTLLCEIEACLNSRPLYPLSNDAEDLSALTPGHLLVGEPLTAVPEPGLTHLRIHTLDHWKLITNMRDHFWHRWSREYIHHLQTVNKWQVTKGNLKEGALVLLKDEATPPTKWALGRVVHLYFGPDGLVRVASLRTNKGVVKRAIAKICPLPIPP